MFAIKTIYNNKPLVPTGISPLVPEVFLNIKARCAGIKEA